MISLTDLFGKVFSMFAKSNARGGDGVDAGPDSRKQNPIIVEKSEDRVLCI
jgi:hypothetical protein